MVLPHHLLIELKEFITLFILLDIIAIHHIILLVLTLLEFRTRLFVLILNQFYFLIFELLEQLVLMVVVLSLPIDLVISEFW